MKTTHLCSPRTSRILLAAALVLLGFFVLRACFTTDVSYDGNTYHIPAINQWAVSSSIHEVNPEFPLSELINGYPKGAETVTFVFVQTFGSTLLNFTNIFYMPLGLLGTALLCHMFGASTSDSLLFGICFLLVPSNVFQYNTTYVDAALGSTVVALLSLFIAGFLKSSGNWISNSIVLGCSAANVIAIKDSGLVIVALSTTGFVFLCFLFRNSEKTPRKKPMVQFMQILLPSVIVALAIGGWWYIRNYILHGSPLYPVGVVISHHQIWPGKPTLKVLAEIANTPPSLLRQPAPVRVLISWLQGINLHHWEGGGADVRLGGLGSLWLLCCVPAIIITMIGLSKPAYGFNERTRILFWFLALIVTLSFLATPMNWWGRYTVWVYALGMPAMWLALARLGASSSLGRFARFFALVSLGYLMIQGVGIATRLGASQISILSTAIGPNSLKMISKDQAGPLKLFPSMRSRLLVDIIRTQSAIGIGPGDLAEDNAPILGQLSFPIGQHDLIPLSSKSTDRELLRAETRQHLQYILWQASDSLPDAIALHTVKLGVDGPFALFEVLPEKLIGK